MGKSFTIDGRRVGADEPPYVVAELSANHRGSLNHALSLIELANAAGADAVKLQTYTTDTLTIDHDGDDFRITGGLWDGRKLFDLYQEGHLPWEWHEALFEHGRALNITVFSTPFDTSAIDLLERLGAPAYKIASFEMIDLPLVRSVAKTGKPTIISTGMASADEITETVDAFRSAGGRDLALLHCVSGYPTPVEQVNLRRIPELATQFGCPIGLSDHTLGIEVALASTALGACIIEKHFISERSEGGLDAAFSLEPREFAALVTGTRAAFAALGTGGATRSRVEESSKVFRRSIYVVRDIAAGELFTTDNVRIIRPGFGLPPKHLGEILGKRARRALVRGTRMSWDLVE
jgi:N-acetylneuraminate synthase